MEHAHPNLNQPEVTKSKESSCDRSISVRSFDCTFCKRGFSNAQALGGHMNMHRKDKAKLKQPSRRSRFPFDISGNIPAPVPSCTYRGSRESLCMYRWRWSTLPGAEDGYRYSNLEGSSQQLPSFAERPSRADDHDKVEMKQTIEHGMVETELDLELRLGRSEMRTGFKEFL